MTESAGHEASDLRGLRPNALGQKNGRFSRRFDLELHNRPGAIIGAGIAIAMPVSRVQLSL